MYAGLTTADKGALLDAKAKGYLYVIYRENEPLAFWRTSPDRLDSIIGYDMIDIALAQIEEMESNKKALLSEKAIEKGCMTWNERINQMTVDEKAKWLYDLDVCRVSSISIDECHSYRHCTECMRNMLNSPYTEGETK